MKHSEKVMNMLQTEKAQGFHDLAIYEAFAENVTTNLRLLANAVSFQKNMRPSILVAGYGAAAKTSTIMGILGSFLSLDYVVDDAPMKVGRFIPGTDIPIKPTSALKDHTGPLAVVLFAHNFKDEILNKIRAQRPDAAENTDIIINMVPEVSLEDLYEK